VAVEVDPFPASDFDNWASTYDQNVLDETHFPFIGYQQALAMVVQLAAPQAGMRVLDLGTGTGNLAAAFTALGSRVWGTDFSPAMLEKAQCKLPQIHFVLADVRQGWPPELPPVFERIVSAYVFHHFDLVEKVHLLTELSAHLAPDGRLVIADIAFADQASLENVRRAVGEAWEDEFYWLADETIAALHQSELCAVFTPVSVCAGVFVMERQ
jgi:putative AdoMet-dependent methyltransferase